MQITLKLDSLDCLQLIEAVDAKATAWRNTEDWLRAHPDLDLEPFATPEFPIEECSDPYEARAISKQYQELKTLLDAEYSSQTQSV